MTSERPGRSRIGVVISVVGAALMLGDGGCCDSDPQCEPAVSSVRTDVSSARLPAMWTQTSVRSFRIVVATGPYRASDTAVGQLRQVMTDRAGLDVEVSEGSDTGLSGSGVLDADAVVAAGRRQIPAGTDAAAVIVTVDDTTEPDATYGFIDYRSGMRPTAVIALHRGPIAGAAVGPFSAEAIESTVLVHEVGHWLGVPARDYHTSSIDDAHCTNARCVMFKGSRMTPCVVAANVCTGIPVTFCPDCADELGEMRRRRETAP
jgi:predicted Zn-dependent protease